MSVDKQTEYATLRQEILDSITSRDNYIMAMYTITTAVLCVAFELQNPILFLIPYVILFAFQNAIASKNENMIVLATYIAVWLEDGNGWESMNIDLKNIMHEGITFNRPRSIWSRLVGRIGSVQLGILCSVSCIVYAVPEVMTATQIDEIIEPGICAVLAFVLYILIRVQTRDVLKLSERKKSYIKNLHKAKKKRKKELALSI